jgi:hypothetical protein
VGFVHLLRILIPGVGQVVQDRHLSALIYFFMFVFFVNGIFIGQHILLKLRPETVRWACGGLAALCWLISAYDYLHTEGVRRRRAAAEPRG